MSDEERSGPIEDHTWPARLPARVVAPGPAARIRGYALLDDIAKNYSLTDQIYLTLCGELPAEKVSLAFEKAVQLLAATSVAQAPVHTAVVARLCGAASSASFAAGMVALTEQANYIADRYREILACVARDQLPSSMRAAGESERRAVQEAAALCDFEMEDFLRLDPDLVATLLLVLIRCGLKTPASWIALITWARAPVVFAEAMEQPPLKFTEYPMNLPEFEYEESVR